MATGIFGSRAILAQESQARTLSITQGQVLGSWDWPMADAINAEADEEYDDDEVLEEDTEDEELDDDKKDESPRETRTVKQLLEVAQRQERTMKPLELLLGLEGTCDSARTYSNEGMTQNNIECHVKLTKEVGPGEEGAAMLNGVTEKFQVNVAEKFQENEKEAVAVEERTAELTGVAEKFQANEEERIAELKEDTKPAELTGVTEKFQVLREGGHRKAQ